jgi:hypothetical protein
MAFYKWTRGNKECMEKYRLAKEIQGHCFAEDTIKISDEKVFSKEDASRQRSRISARQWYAEKMAPKTFGQKLGIGAAEGLDPLATRTALDVNVDETALETYRRIVRGG